MSHTKLFIRVLVCLAWRMTDSDEAAAPRTLNSAASPRPWALEEAEGMESVGGVG